MHIGYVPRKRPPFSALNFHSGTYHFHKLPKNLFRSITILHFLADFAVPEIIIFNISLISTRSSAQPERKAFRSAAASWQFRRFAFSLSEGSSSFRSPTFSRSTGSSFRSPGPFFTLPRYILTKIWGEYPPGHSTCHPDQRPSPYKTHRTMGHFITDTLICMFDIGSIIFRYVKFCFLPLFMYCTCMYFLAQMRKKAEFDLH